MNQDESSVIVFKPNPIMIVKNFALQPKFINLSFHCKIKP